MPRKPSKSNAAVIAKLKKSLIKDGASPAVAQEAATHEVTQPVKKTRAKRGHAPAVGFDAQQMMQEMMKMNAEMIQSAVTNSVKAAMEVGIAVASQSKSIADKNAAEEAVRAKYAAMEVCGECGQKKIACRGEHAQMVVFPSDPRKAKFFQGVIINGVKYDSVVPGRAILVPKANNILETIARWEVNEDETQNGKQLFLESGSVSMGGSHNWKPAPARLN